MQEVIQPNPIQNQTPPVVLTHTSKSTVILFCILGFLLITCSVFVGFQAGKKQRPIKQDIVTEPLTTPAPPDPPINPFANWKTFKNENYKYEIQYPSEWNTIASIQKGDKTEPIGMQGADLKGKVVNLHKNYPNERVQPFLEISVWPESSRENFESRKPSWKGTELTFQGNPAVKSTLNSEGEPSINLLPGVAIHLLVYSEKNTSMYEISCNEDQLNVGFCDLILSTLNFID